MDVVTIVVIHQFLVEYFAGTGDPISPVGIKDITVIESAVARPDSTAGGRDAYLTVFMKAAALFHSIASNHGFHNGNKRAALLATLYYLSEHGYWLDKCTDEEMYEFTRKTAAHEICPERRDEVETIAHWLEQNSTRQAKGDRPMKLFDLREALAQFGFLMVDNGRMLDVIKEGAVVATVHKRGCQGFEDYDPPYIAELRKRLGLVPSEGVDSAKFYGRRGLDADLNEFMQMRLDVMRRLAKE